MPAGIMERPFPHGPEEDEKLENLDHLLGVGPRVKPSDEHWKQAWDELPMPEIKDPGLAGLWSGGRPPGAALDEHMKRVKQRAWDLANGGQVVVTSDSLRRPK